MSRNSCEGSQVRGGFSVSVDVPATLQAAAQQYGTGNIELAERMFRMALEAQPDHPLALHSLGVVACQAGRYDEAVGLISRAITANPGIPEFYNSLGVAYEGLGKSEHAIGAYLQAVSIKPDYVEAYHNMAIALQSKGDYTSAARKCAVAISLKPDYAKAYNTMGFILQMQDDYTGAGDNYRKAIHFDPNFAEAYNHLGVVLSKQENFEEAINNYRRALTIIPDYAEVYNNLSIALKATGRFDEAIEHCRRALTLEPQFAEAYFNMGNTMKDQGRHEEAIDNYRRALEINPDYAEVYSNLAIALNELDRYEEATENCQQAIRLKCDYAEAYNNLGIILRNQERFAEAIEHYEQAIHLEPQFHEAYYNLGNCFKELGRCEDAISNYEKAILIKPDYAQAHWNLSHAFLLSGDLERGWKEYQWRRNPELSILTYPHQHDKPRWDGSTFTGKRLLVHCEQGLGDSLQFARYLPMVKARGGTVIFEAWKPLHGILCDFEGIDELLELSFTNKTDADFDFHVSLMDLPGIFDTTPDTIPNEVPYIHADPEKVRCRQNRLCCDGFKIAIVWAGSPAHGNDKNRSCPLELFESLAAIDGVRLYSLQKGAAVSQLDRLAGQMKIENFSDELGDFADTAALIANMDLIISVDTAPAHLAGAMARPTWVLLPFAPDWRWMLDRSDSPWYPTMRLFRQKQWGNWHGVFKEITEELRSVTQNRNHI